jgi:hypothetical protein
VTGARTYALLEVSPKVYSEISGKLRAAGYDHAFRSGDDDRGFVIDMHGIALVEDTRGATPP